MSCANHVGIFMNGNLLGFCPNQSRAILIFYYQGCKHHFLLNLLLDLYERQFTYQESSHLDPLKH